MPDAAKEGLETKEVEAVKSEREHSGETVLVVEDEAMVKALAVSILSKAGYKVIEAGEAEEAIRLAREFGNRIDLLLTDVIMPGIKGKELYEMLSGFLPELKVLYMSGYMNDIIAKQGILEPGVNFVQKPFSRDGLLDEVSKVLRN